MSVILKCIKPKGNQWHFGMKAHGGVDAETGVVHTLVTTQPTSRCHPGPCLAAWKNGLAWVMPATKALKRENQGRQIQWESPCVRAKRKALPDTPDGRLQERIEQVKASIRAKVEHPFRIIRTSSA